MAVFSDYKIDLTTGDRVFSDNGQFARVEDAACVQQWLWTRFKILFGEWFLNRQAGFKARRLLFSKTAPPGALEAHVKRLILTTTGVTGILEPVFEVDRQTRSVTFSAGVTWVGGAFDIAVSASQAVAPGGFVVLFGRA